jgi:thymidylate synthase (FAD)
MTQYIDKVDNVLNEGYVILWDKLGSDLTPVNSAKVSYDKRSEEFGKREEGLVDFLAREEHTSPFRHGLLQFECYAPLMVARQWWKYIIGSGHTEFDEQSGLQDPFTAWNESSRRYITEEPVFYLVQPSEWRTAPENSKQGSGEPVDSELGMLLSTELKDYVLEGVKKYENALRNGVCAEQARLFLPAYGLYVRWYWTASVQGVAHFLNQRLAHDAQKEIQLFAEAVDTLSRKVFPVAINKLVK